MFFFSSRRRHTRFLPVSWARRCVQETELKHWNVVIYQQKKIYFRQDLLMATEFHHMKQKNQLVRPSIKNQWQIHILGGRIWLMIKGQKIYLTAIERKDLKQLLEWRNLVSYRKYFREYREINYDLQEIWYENKVLNDPSTIMFSIRLITDGSLIGCCGLCYINWIHRNADLSLYIGWNESYIDDRGFAEESCKLLFDYGFKEIGLNKIWTEIYEFDSKKYKLYHQLGLKDDGFLRQQYYYDGKWWNSYIMSIVKQEYNIVQFLYTQFSILRKYW
eukprot:TRINITY_DN35029_c0_g1_i2.p2 TRINITY_DN35029_c0_g1~~TRINITY_DN35029_c0_g1_i2.p2  ORF type:complete len:275 (-),score=24.63 TRINITY_DN35029_c0_g1_i2:651-1475(-)